MNWKEYWNRFPGEFPQDQFLEQVGKTVQGQPISDSQLDAILVALVQELDLNPADHVLDLCCGNGLITSRVAAACHSVTGVDFSEPLIEVARKYHGGPGLRYFCMSVMDITPEDLAIREPFDKIYMYESLQYFQESQMPTLLRSLLALAAERSVFLFTSVPDREHLLDFYNTPERKAEYERRLKEGTEAIGTWWNRSVIQSASESLGLRSEFLPQPASSHTAHYRFDVRITRA